MADFQIRVTPSPGIPEAVEAVAVGRITSIKEVQILQSSITGAMVGRASILLLDLKDVPTIASSGLSFLADLVGRLEPKGGSIVMIHVSPSVKVVLNSLGLVQFLQFEDDMESARAFAVSQAENTRHLPRIYVRNGIQLGTVYTVGSPIIIGNDPQATINVSSHMIEKRHAEVSRSGDIVTVKDLNSRAGTIVGQKKVTQETLKPGDRIFISELELQYLGPGDPIPTHA